MPRDNFAPALHEMSEKHGDIVYFDLLAQPVVVIDSYDAAVALLNSRTAQSSGRPRLVMAEMTGITWGLILQQYSPTWRRYRRILHEHFNQGAITRYRETHLHHMRKLLKNLLERPEEFFVHIKGMVAGSIMGIVYGVEVADGNDWPVVAVEKGSFVFGQTVVPGRYLVELFPVLSKLPAWLPWAKFKRDAAVWREDAQASRNVPYGIAIQAIAKGVATPSIVSSFIDQTVQKHGEVLPEEEEVCKDISAVAYIAGNDTTVATLKTFFLAMVTHPDVQQNAQAELDRVIGSSRLPTFEDHDSLPYTHAVIKECLRWHSVLPLGIPHAATEDIEYDGYWIPKGSVLYANVWAMTRDALTYPEPEKFKPERFLKEDGLPDADVRDPAELQFGFGRRVCPGRALSEDILFITVASVLHSFSIHPPLDEHGNPTVVKPKLPMDSTVSHPDPFGCRIVPRSAAAAWVPSVSV
ncbi:cytochrome P450 [Daedaleopsis nitida]|nr:cytochrome P450 [Daedaleopsis nitida]